MINVIGLGYIGLPTALMLAKSGNEVVGTDINKELITKLNNGDLMFEENGLKLLFEQAIDKGVKFRSDYIKTDIYIVAVPTPYISNNKRIDPKYIISAVNNILDICEYGTIIVIESTISPGTIDRFIRPEIEKRNKILRQDIHLVHAPERIIPGNMIYELENNSRTIGADDLSISEKIKKIYSSFCKGEIVLTDIRTAEMSKVVENTYRDVNIAFANELAKICRSDNMNVYEIIRIANKHPRVNILQPGPGVGGHCISVDPWFLVGDYPDLTNLILTARKTNDSMPSHVLSRIRTIMKDNDINNLTRVGVYGLTYKENVDDTRESPTLQMIEKMEEHLSFINEIDIIVIMVAHDHIKNNLDIIKNKKILDTKNICNFNGVYKL
jgi:UDP-N-acetyl-D-mannosaminuronic acid dehydrogenase